MPELSPLLSYHGGPLLIAAGLVILLGMWGVMIWWLTRKRPPKVLANLPLQPDKAIDTTELKARYLKQIAELEAAYATKQQKARAVHQSLSLLLRQFVSEIEHVPANTMTLADLKKTRHVSLAAVIETYYQPEFALVRSGNVPTACEAARKVVSSWR